MKKIYLSRIAFLIAMMSLIFSNSFAVVTNPAGFDLSTGNYSFNNWPAASAAGTYPPNMMFQWINVGDATMANYVGDLYADYACAYQNPPITSGPRIFGLGTNGFSFFNTGSAQSNACAIGQGGFSGGAELALITTGRSNIQVSWTSSTITPNPRLYGVRLQYRVGVAGNYTDVPGPVEYLSVATANIPVNVGPVTLPATCENQPVVDLRWVYYYISGSGARSEINVTNISVTSQPGYFTVANQVGLTTLNTNQPLPSPAGTFQLSGTALSAANTTVQFSPATANFELSTNNTNFYSSLTLPNSNGGLTGQPVTIYVRQSAVAPLGTNSATIQISATGATSSTVNVSGTVNPPVPSIVPSTTSLTGFSAYVGNPSPAQNFNVSGVNLVANVTATAPAGYEISLNNITFAPSLILPQSGGTLINQPVYIYVRITAAAPLGPVNGTLTLTSTNAVTQNVSLSGMVTVPPPVITTTALVPGGPFSTIIGNASPEQTFTVSGNNLVGDVTITPPAAYELSLDNITYLPALTISQVGGVLPGQPVTVYARIAAAAPAGPQNGNISLTSANAITQNIPVVGNVIVPTVTATGTVGLFSTMSGNPSASQVVTLNGSNLIGDVTVAAPAGFEISTDDITYTSSLLLLQVGGSLVGQPLSLYIRIAASATGWVSGDVQLTSPGAPTVNIHVRGNANIPFTNGDIAITRVGDSVTLSNTGSIVFVDEYTPAGTLVQSIILPYNDMVGNNFLCSGTATSEGFVTRSLDGRYLAIAGYNRATGGVGTISGTTSATVNREVALVKYDGTVDVSTSLPDAGNTGNARGAITTNGTDIWIGCSTDGVRYTTVGSNSSLQIATTPTNVRDFNIAETGGVAQLFISSGSGGTRVATIGTGLPTTTGQTITNIPGPVLSSPYQYFFADLSETVPGVDVLYVADDAVGLVRFSLVAGSWVQDGVIGAPADKFRSVAGSVDRSTGTMTLYAVAGFDGNATGNGGTIYSFTDNMGYAPVSFTAPALTTLVAAGTNNKISYRGVALVPYNPACAANSLTWTGNASGNTKLPENWCGLVAPTANDNITIDPLGPINQPVIDSPGNVANTVIVNSGAILDFKSGGVLDVHGDIQNNGTFHSNEGSLIFSGIAGQSAPGFTVANLTMQGLQLYTTGNMQVDTSLTMTSGDLYPDNNMVILGTSPTSPGTLTYTSGHVLGYMKRWFAAATNAGDATGLFPFSYNGDDRLITVEYTQAPASGGSLVGHYFYDNNTLTINNGNPLTVTNLAPCAGTFQPVHVVKDMFQLTPADGFPNTGNAANDGTYDVTLKEQNLQDYTNVCELTALKSDDDIDFFEDGVHQGSTLVGNTVIARRTGASGWSDWSIAGSAANPLPIKLTSFDGRRLGNIQAQLQWRVSAEGTENFILQRSADGDSFATINMQQAKTGSGDYSYTDNMVTGKNFYRLAVKELSGKVTYSNVVVIDMNGSGLQLVSIAPNVINGNATVHVLNDVAATATLRIIDAMGRLVMTDALQLNAGSTYFTFNASGLRAGAYLMQVVAADGATVQQRFIKQ
jgi:hypothetical protein